MGDASDLLRCGFGLLRKCSCFKTCCGDQPYFQWSGVYTEKETWMREYFWVLSGNPAKIACSSYHLPWILKYKCFEWATALWKARYQGSPLFWLVLLVVILLAGRFFSINSILPIWSHVLVIYTLHSGLQFLSACLNQASQCIVSTVGLAEQGLWYQGLNLKVCSAWDRPYWWCLKGKCSSTFCLLFYFQLW